MSAYYNEINPYAAQWLRNLIKAGHIADGEVDERSIRDVVASDVADFTQCHFFAGIGVWSYSLRRAGWSDDRPVWTGSCPCQPFSTAGKQAGFADERHLWPVWFKFIQECRPDNVFGEQVASKDGLAWLDLVLSDLENANYAAGAIDLCAAGVGAPHIRQRLWIVADSSRGRSHRIDSLLRTEDDRRIGQKETSEVAGIRIASQLAYSESNGRREERKDIRGGGERSQTTQLEQRLEYGGAIKLADSDVKGLEGRDGGSGSGDQLPARPNGVDSFWESSDWIQCRDGKARPFEPGTFPLVDGPTKRSVGKLRAYGNAIVAPAATEIIRAYLETERAS